MIRRVKIGIIENWFNVLGTFHSVKGFGKRRTAAWMKVKALGKKYANS